MSEPSTGAGAGRGIFAAAFLGDLLLVAGAWLIYEQASRPMNPYELGGVALCTALGAWLGVWPFVLQHRAAMAREERADLADTLAQIQRVENVGHQIEVANSQWQTAQEHATAAVNAAREIAERMSTEQQQFRAFLEQANDTQRQHLELELNKLRRAEGEWLQTAVRVMDHVYGLYAAATRAGQPSLAQQIGGFQNACREAMRRVGLVPIVVSPGAPFDANLHQPLDSSSPVPEHAVVADVIGTGYSFQGQLLRRVVVALQPTGAFAASQPLPTSASVAFSTSQPVESDEVGEAEADAPPPPAPDVAAQTNISVSEPPEPPLAGTA